jgi:hypothetical protein
MNIAGASAVRRKFLGPMLAAMAAACAHDVPTSPDTFSIEPAKVMHLRSPQAVAFKNAHRAEAPRSFGVGMGQTWIVEQRQLTDTAIVMLTRAVEKQGIKAPAQAEKSITLHVRAEDAFLQSIPFSPVAQSNARLILEAEFGDGTRTWLRAENNSPLGVQRAFDGAVLFALNRLLADEKFVAYMNTAGADPRGPPVAAVPVVAAATLSAPPAAQTRFPQVGDTWTYDLIQRGRDVRPAPRPYLVKVVYSSEAKISDHVSLGGGPPVESDHPRGRYLVTQVVSILSPYLGVFEELSAGASLGEIVTSTDLGCRGPERCEVSGKVVGRDIVRVPAGEFEAVRVMVSQAWRNPSGYQGGAFDARRELTGWYSPQVKRFVKFASRTKMGREPDFDLELVKYDLK